MEKIFESIGLPDGCKVGNTLFKKLFYENAVMNNRDKEIFKDHIKKIVWEYSLKPDTINIQPFKDEEREYAEIALLSVELVEGSKYKRIAEIIQKSIPYPLILVMKCDSQVVINVALRRLNKNDATRDSIEEMQFTKWISIDDLKANDISFLDSINVKALSFSNLLRFYSEFVDKINIYNASQYTGAVYTTELKADELKCVTADIEEIENQIIAARNDLKKEKHFNKKMKINIMIKKLEESKAQLIHKM